MEIISRPQERENPSSTNSPNSDRTSSNNSNGAQIQTPPVTPKPINSRSETNPTTFVQADTTSFKQVVQMLTGSPETANQASKPPPPAAADPPPSSKISIPPIIKRKQSFKLYERRSNLKNGLMIGPLVPCSGQNSGFFTQKSEIWTPSVLDFPSLVLSPVTPLIEDPFRKSSPSIGISSEEEKAIAEKGFYLHPSPSGSEPRLLPLFPVSSPRVSESST